MLNTGYECSARGSHVSRFYWHSLSLIIEIVALPSYLFCKRFITKNVIFYSKKKVLFGLGNGTVVIRNIHMAV